MHRKLVIISDLWGAEHSTWWPDYQSYFDKYYDEVILKDARRLAGILPTGLSQQEIHSQFLNGGIEKAVSHLLAEYGGKYFDLLGFSIGGYIAWQVALSSSNVSRLAAVSATRLRYEHQHPSADRLVVFGSNDEHKPDKEWTAKMEAVNIPRQGHDLYKNINLLKPHLQPFFELILKRQLYETIATANFYLIDISQAGSKSVLAIKSDPLIHTYLEKQPLSTSSEAASFVDKITEGIAAGKWYYWGIQPRKSEDIIGTICLWNFSADHRVADIGYELLPSYWGQGVMLECVQAVLDFGFNQLQLQTVEAYTHVENDRSLTLLKRHGFTYIEGDALGNNYAHYALHR